jgi:hypothetical protein
MQRERIEAVLLAASRLTPRMLAYQLRRWARNAIASRWPRLYAARIDDVLGRTPPRADPDLGDKSALEAAAAFYQEHYRPVAEDAARGRFTFYGQTIDFGAPETIDWTLAIPEEGDHQLWRMKLAHMGFLCPMLLSNDARQHQAAARIIRSFMAKAGDWSAPAAFSSIWFPYSASHRILAAGSAYWLNNRAISADVALEVEAFLRLNVAFVRDNVEHEARNNHVERNLAALCLFYDRVEEGGGQARMLDREVRRLIEATVSEDGLNVERSAMYQGLTVMALRIFASTRLLSPATRALAARRAAAAAEAWADLSHPDGEIALFNDAWIGETPPPGALAGARPHVGRRLLEHAGYARLSDGDNVALLDAGPIGPRWNPGHGHADFLSLEISLRGRRLIVDPGTSRYSSGPERHFERSSRAHNGPHYMGQELITYAGCFKVGRMAEARLLGLQDDELSVVAGTLETPLGAVRRLVALRPGAGFLVIDLWARQAQLGTSRLLVPAEWRLASGESGLRFTQAETSVALDILYGAIDRIGESQWCRRYLNPEAAHELVLRPDVSTGGQGVAAFTVGEAWPDGLAQAQRLLTRLREA